MFEKVPLYIGKYKIDPVYINETLCNRLFNTQTFSFEEKSDLICNLFNITININNSNKKQIGWAYIDKQNDPTNISLNGNIVSGRSYYIGKIFNIKGEKTPLATSNIDYYADGILDIKNAIRETIFSNLFAKESTINTIPILAIIDIKKNLYHVMVNVWK